MVTGGGTVGRSYVSGWPHIHAHVDNTDSLQWVKKRQGHGVRRRAILEEFRVAGGRVYSDYIKHFYEILKKNTQNN